MRSQMKMRTSAIPSTHSAIGSEALTQSQAVIGRTIQPEKVAYPLKIRRIGPDDDTVAQYFDLKPIDLWCLLPRPRALRRNGPAKFVFGHGISCLPIISGRVRNAQA